MQRYLYLLSSHEQLLLKRVQQENSRDQAHCILLRITIRLRRLYRTGGCCFDAAIVVCYYCREYFSAFGSPVRSAPSVHPDWRVAYSKRVVPFWIGEWFRSGSASGSVLDRRVVPFWIARPLTTNIPAACSSAPCPRRRGALTLTRPAAAAAAAWIGS